MKPFLAIVVLAFLAFARQQAMQEETWSPVVDGLRGRLIPTSYTSEGRTQLRIDLELENVSDLGNPISIWWVTPVSDRVLELSIETADGRPIAYTGGGGDSGFYTRPYWLQVPRRSSIRINVSTAACHYGPDGTQSFRPLNALRWWSLPAGPIGLVIHGTLTTFPRPDTQFRSWVGPINLPRVGVR